MAAFNDTDTNGYFSTCGWTGATGLSTTSSSTKYATKYSNSSTTYYGTEKEHEVGKIGDATKEVNTQGDTTTSHWFTDCSAFVYSSPFFSRGGIYYNVSATGVFCSGCDSGSDYFFGSFRVVLAP